MQWIQIFGVIKRPNGGGMPAVYDLVTSEGAIPLWQTSNLFMSRNAVFFYQDRLHVPLAELPDLTGEH